MMRYLFAGAAAAALVAAPPAFAQNYADEDTGFYIQGGYSYLDLQPEGADSGVDTNAITIRSGVQLTPMFGIEADITSGIDDGEFDYNVDEDEVDFDDNEDNDFDDLIAASGDVQLNYLVGAYVRGILPVSDRFDLSARAGYAFVDVDAEVTTPGGTTFAIADSEDGFSAGAGATWDLTESWELRADYTWFGFDEVDVNAGTVALGYKF